MLKPQSPAPQFAGTAVLDGYFKKISLDDYKGRYLILLFYPLDFTFVCPTEITSFSDHLGEFRKINTEVLACSTDSEYTHLAWTSTPRNKGGLADVKIPLLSDKSMKIARSYGVLDENTGVSFRGVFIIDAKGILRHLSVNDFPVGRSVGEVLRLVKAFQYTDEFGEVCPANWKPGGKTMKPDPVKSQEYFSHIEG
ncbi:C-terminal domain of 1-Cys peroxiredoxin [Popillia japonica]|uniref:thioredoxin-dependent peroxiredoxin n=1 Tax=Popillia japonica TaxID=7064 RepID=A0AAW1HSC7_POPJA